MKVTSTKVRLAVIVSVLSACVLSAKANPVINVDGYAITTITGSYNNPGTAATLEAQPWWGSLTLSYQLASDLNTQLGMPNPQTGTTGVSPYFAEGEFNVGGPTTYLRGYTYVNSGSGAPYT